VLSSSEAVVADDHGNIFVTDNHNYRVRKVTSDGIIHTAVGGGSLGDGALATRAALSMPLGVALDALGQIYIADKVVRKVTTDGIIHDITGSGQDDGDGSRPLRSLFDHRKLLLTTRVMSFSSIQVWGSGGSVRMDCSQPWGSPWRVS
jgi:hypothetical protein